MTTVRCVCVCVCVCVGGGVNRTVAGESLCVWVCVRSRMGERRRFGVQVGDAIYHASFD